ncbi:MAG: 50S ribosomal protein L18e [archaeon]
MRTGPTKDGTRKVILSLEKHGKKSGKRIWRDLSERVARPSRIRAKVNLYKVAKLAAKMPEKIFVVPGKLLSVGEVNSRISVACLECSAKARQKIEMQKGKVMSLEELLASKPKESNLVVVQ